jgi:hypothetical protein
MLVAVDGSGLRRTAAADLDVAVFCPDCRNELVVRAPSRRVPHFAHKAGQRCDAAHVKAARTAARRKATAAARARERLAAELDSGQDSLFDLAEGVGDPTPQYAAS